MNLKTALGTFCLGMFAGCDTASCVRGADPTLDCTVQSEAFMASYADDGQLLAEIPDKNTYPMAMVLTEVGLNRLLTENVSGKIPFASSLPFGPLELKFTPTSEPKILIERVKYCSQCILFTVDFSFGLLDGDGEGQGSGLGTAQVSIPLSLTQNDDGTSSLVANYEKINVLELPFITMGISSEDEPGLQGALEILLTEELQKNFGPTELLRLEPWTIGDGKVQLAARDFQIFHDTRVISFALQTNLDLPPDFSIAIADRLPNGLPDTVPMLIQMHPGLLFVMAQRMIVEGKISRNYNDDGQPDPDGLYGMTLESMEANDISGSNILDVGFRVWRTQDDYCGYADAVTGLKLGIANNSISVTPTDELRVVGGEGIGELAATDEELVEMNKKLVESFKKDLSEQVGITINYNDLNVAGATVAFEAAGLALTKGNIDIVIDFQVYAEEAP
jgi:hypothetical protein